MTRRTFCARCKEEIGQMRRFNGGISGPQCTDCFEPATRCVGLGDVHGWYCRDCEPWPAPWEEVEEVVDARA